MAIDVQCGDCFHAFRVSDKHAGKRGKCPSCGTPVRVPDGTLSDMAAPPASQPVLRRHRLPDEPKKRRSTSGNPNGLVLGLAGGVIVLLSIVAILLMREPGQPGPEQGATAEQSVEPPAGTPSDPVRTGRASDVAAAPVQPVKAYTAPPPTVQTTTAKVSPGIAPGGNVETKVPRTVESPPATDDNSDLPSAEPLSPAELVKRVEPSIVRINALNEADDLEWHGSGFVIDPSGVIATNHHVVAGAFRCVAEFASGKTFDVEGYYLMDEKRDIALLKIDLPDGEYQALPLAASRPDKGEQVLAFGCPYGLDFSTTDGLVSAFRSAADLKSMLDADVDGEWLQTSAPISPGNSGGPLVNMRGEVVGINSLVRTEGQNLNFAISAQDVQSKFDRRGETITALSRGTESDDGKVNLIGSRAAERYLAKIDTVLLLVRSIGSESSDEMKSTVESFAKKHLRDADIGVTGIRSVTAPIMYITVEAQDGVEQGTADVAVVVQLLFPRVVDDTPMLLIVWEQRDEIASPKKYKLRRNPKGELQEGLSTFFENVSREIKAAKKRAG